MKMQMSPPIQRAKHSRGERLCAMVMLAAACSVGCATTTQEAYDDRGLVLAEKSIGSTEGASDPALEQTAALIDGVALSWDQIRPFMAEAGGRLALEELALDYLVDREARRRAVVLTREDIDRERDLLTDSIAQTAGAGDSQDAARIVMAVRRRRGLGPERFAGLVRRSALLRKMVQPEVNVSSASVAQLYDLIHGPRYQARLITVDSVDEASRISRRLADGERFGDVAATRSTDASAARGGIIEPISPADTAYPASIRRALEQMNEGDISTPIALNEGYAILLLEEIIEPDGVPPEDVRAELENAARRQQERLLMNRLADQLLDAARITILDDSLDFAWSARTP